MFDKRWGKKFAAFNSILIPINAIAPTTLNKVALGLVSVGFLCGASEFIRGGRKERLYDSEIENRIRNSKTPRIRELREKYDNWFVVGKKDRRFKHPIKNPRYRFELVFTNEPQRLIDTLTGKRKRRT